MTEVKDEVRDERSVVTLAFALIASVACWIPARRAAALEPMEAMRVE